MKDSDERQEPREQKTYLRLIRKAKNQMWKSHLEHSWGKNVWGVVAYGRKKEVRTETMVQKES
jgi:hypothetical protein